MKHLHKGQRAIVATAVLALLLLVAWLFSRAVYDRSAPCNLGHSSSGDSGLALPVLLSKTDAELSQLDIERMNLLCASGLPGSDATDLGSALAELDRMARRVKVETDRHWRKFQTQPEEFNHSDAYFRMLCMVTVLQQDCGIRYNPNRARPSDGPIEPNEAFFADSADIFLSGLVGNRRMGTCASLPVLYVAVGRRLGYPLKLAAAKNHLFVRWDGERERLNIEATTQGLTTFDDEYYRSWPFPMTTEEERTEHYLKSMTGTEELATFLSLRAQCLIAARRLQEALEVQERTCRLIPQSNEQRKVLEQLRTKSRQSKS